jgi:hypothetical protein
VANDTIRQCPKDSRTHRGHPGDATLANDGGKQKDKAALGEK